MSLSSPYSVIAVTPPPPYRGGPAQAPLPDRIRLSSGTITYAWGCEPGEATLHYDLDGGVPVTSGWSVTIYIGGYTFYGQCVSDKAMDASGGKHRELRFADNRTWMDYDRVFCSFNKLDDHLVSGVRVKRYVHITPANYTGLIKTYTDNPYTASEMIQMILDSNYVKDKWVPIFHDDQNAYPVYNVEASGKSLKTLLQEITDAQGLLFTLDGGPFRLVWQRKGDITYTTPTPPIKIHPLTGVEASLTDNRGSGTSLSNHPTRICILGDRNIYQIHEIPMVADWKPGWEEFFDINLFREDIYNRGKLKQALTINGHTFAIGTLYKDIGGTIYDPDQIISRQLALAYSLEISVVEYATLRADLTNFADYRKFAGKTRLDMPATLYIEQLLFRAFRFPDGFSIKNASGVVIPVDSLEVASKMIARVTHDPLTGEMTWDVNQSADGNGYAIIKGYQVGKDLFKTLNPDRFRLTDWTDAQEIWEHAEFEIDDSGEPQGKLILFSEPIIKSSNLVKIVNGYGVFNAAPTKINNQPGFDTPDVRIAICFAAERYQSYWGTGTRDEVESVSDLNAEWAGTYGLVNFEEVPYSDGKLSDQKAYEFALPLLTRQYTYDYGSYQEVVLPMVNGKFPAGITLQPKIDRITLSHSSSGTSVTVEYTNELPRQFYVPERDMDRNVKLKALLPGQAQLRSAAVTAKIMAAALQQSPKARKTIGDAFKNLFGSVEPVFHINI